MSEQFLRIALPTPLRRLFDYLAPPGVDVGQLQAGMRVVVPFGSRKIVGVLLGLTTTTQVPAYKLRSAIEILDQQPLLPAQVMHLVQWAAQYYQHSLGDSFSWAMPALLRQGEAARLQQRTLYLALPGVAANDVRIKNAPRQRQALQVLLQHASGIGHEQLSAFGLQKNTIDALLGKGLIEQKTVQLASKKSALPLLAQPPLSLNTEQQLAVDAVARQLNRFQVFLLAGVTGSGKTEVYLQLIEKVLQRGQQVLVLIPEINLGPQTFVRFRQRFNARLALLHSEVNDRQRLQAWLEARDGQADIVIGTRSAIFTPFKNLGLIVVDEEHDASYKQQEGLRYHARDLALVRAQKAGIAVVLGSATPSLESLRHAESGRYGLLRLQQRAGSAKAPEFVLLDVRNVPLDCGISHRVVKEIQRTLDNGQQVLVFLNRRGFAPVLLCHDCGWMGQCCSCDARLTLHQGYNELRCHHCGHVEKRPLACPSCASLQLHPVGEGTERAEERLQQIFAGVPVLRIDRDSTARKGSLDAILQQVHQGKPCILLGTQMLAKGHHFPRVTLVVVVNADGGLFSADFRSSERMAQLIMQVAGRAGRAKEPGRVLIQTRLAEHPLLQQLCNEGYFAFAAQAMHERRATSLPPFSHMALLRAEAVQEQHVQAFLTDARSLAEQLLLCLQLKEVECLGPVAALMERRAGRYRAQLLFISVNRAQLQQLLAQLCFNLEALVSARQARWSMDVDPIDLF